MCPKEARASIINIKFSYKGDFMAISYNNQYFLTDILEDNEHEDNPVQQYTQTKKVGKKGPDISKRDASFMQLYVNSLSAKNPN